MNTTIPNAVLAKAQGLICLYGDCLEFCGLFHGQEVFRFRFPANKETGFPFVYLYEVATDGVREITGFDALRLLSDIMDNKINN